MRMQAKIGRMMTAAKPPWDKPPFDAGAEFAAVVIAHMYVSVVLDYDIVAIIDLHANIHAICSTCKISIFMKIQKIVSHYELCAITT